MDVQTMEVITSWLALVAVAGSVLYVLARLLAPRWGLAGRAFDAVHPLAPWIAALVAVVATLGSLYFSEVANYVPCRYCWYQRIAMYPLAVILPIAAVRRDRGARWYTTPIAAIGLLIALYHYLLERGVLDEGEACSFTGPACADIWFEELGFVTLAFMALAGFASILVLTLVPARRRTPPPEGAS
ncbi:MAG: disulfide bond formation protein B [Ilumatobacteraceae bacterium]|nr:disulfide bond formation protein B [Ilumatobacteraceae bacterium]